MDAVHGYDVRSAAFESVGQSKHLYDNDALPRGAGGDRLLEPIPTSSIVIPVCEGRPELVIHGDTDAVGPALRFLLVIRLRTPALFEIGSYWSRSGRELEHG